MTFTNYCSAFTGRNFYTLQFAFTRLFTFLNLPLSLVSSLALKTISFVSRLKICPRSSNEDSAVSHIPVFWFYIERKCNIFRERDRELQSDDGKVNAILYEVKPEGTSSFLAGRHQSVVDGKWIIHGLSSCIWTYTGFISVNASLRIKYRISSNESEKRLVNLKTFAPV